MANPICPTNCMSNLAVVKFDRCNPKISLSEVRRIFIAKAKAAAFTNAALAAEWTTRLSEVSVTGDDYIRPLTVIGDKPAPSKKEKEISGGRKVVMNKAHVLNFSIDEATPENHEFLRTLECNGTYRIWYETAGGLMFGGNEGIPVQISLDMVLGRGDEILAYNGVCSWDAKFTEIYVDSPIALSY